VARAREQGVSLTGPDGLLKQLTKTVLETALNQELTGHLGHGKHGPAGNETGNVRNGTRPKTVLTEASGQVPIEVPRDRAGPGSRWSPLPRPRAARRSLSDRRWKVPALPGPFRLGR
jgi:transposase-like protein